MSQTVEPWISCSPSVRSACASTRARVAERKGIAERQHGQAKCTTCRSRFICKYGDIFGSQSVSHYHTPSRELMDHTHTTVLLSSTVIISATFVFLFFVSCLPPGLALEDDLLFPSRIASRHQWDTVPFNGTVTYMWHKAVWWL